MLSIRSCKRPLALTVLTAGLLTCSASAGAARNPSGPQPASFAPQASGGAAPSTDQAPGTPFSAEKIDSLLPRAVYFQGRSAPLQIRNAAGTALANGQIVWASLVDTSGYSSSVQEKYQFYLVSEGRLRVGSASLPAGAYGAGVLGDHVLIMDLGGHTVAETPVQTDEALRRPRPLQMVRDQPEAVKLYLGRHWVLLQADTQSGAAAR